MPSVASCLLFISILIAIQRLLPSLPWALFFGLRPPRWKYYLATTVTNSLQAGVALLIGFFGRLPVFGSGQFDLNIVLLALGFLTLNIALLDPVEWKYTSAEVKRWVVSFLPHNSKERLIWCPISLITAASQEIVYRAVFFGLFYRLTGHYWAAGILSAIFFAFNHRGYGPLPVGSTFFVGLVLQWFVRISGGLYIPIAIHFIHNFVALVYAIGDKQELPATSPMAKKSAAAAAK